MIRRVLSSAILACFLLAGCHTASHSNGSAASEPFKTYKLRGKVVTTNSSTEEVTVNHEAIVGFMEAMTMAYKVKDANILSELHPGDVITADLEVSEGPSGDLVLNHIVVVGQGKPDYRPTATYHVPAPGDQVPDFKLKNQDGKPIALDQFRGKQLLITFIYTRCPVPNFCPRVTRQFAEINRTLASQPSLYNKTHLLCVSFDPKNDTPARLRAYAVTYMGGDDKSTFAHWDFAVPDKTTLDKMAQFFDVGLTAEADSTITHTLSTTLIGPDGKVVRFYPGNEWTVDQVMTDIKQTAPKA